MHAMTKYTTLFYQNSSFAFGSLLYNHSHLMCYNQWHCQKLCPYIRSYANTTIRCLRDYCSYVKNSPQTPFLRLIFRLIVV